MLLKKWKNKDTVDLMMSQRKQEFLTRFTYYVICRSDLWSLALILTNSQISLTYVSIILYHAAAEDIYSNITAFLFRFHEKRSKIYILKIEKDQIKYCIKFTVWNTNTHVTHNSFLNNV